ncbi:ATP-binding protein [Qipengyuania flava]|uniref:ATP-binding protein n=1 Tax=Qipengyuania flava TaxID=192812 RepID=UPI001C639D9C|nr:ATP-binding protein [Qipengyuania flava]QYJ06924.1 MASE1 domain-containing protein [Qipengyuania flava]
MSISRAFQRPGSALLVPLLGFALFAITAFASIEIARGEGRIAALWLPNGLAVAALLRFRAPNETVLFGALLAGNLAANSFSGDALGQAFGLALANMLEIFLAVALTRQWCGRTPRMDDIGDLGRFAFAAGICAPIASGIIAASVLSLTGSNWIEAAVKWVFADALAMLILAPSTIIAIDAWRARRKPTQQEVVDWTVLTVLGTGLTFAVFTQTQYPLLFLIPPVVMAHAFRLGSLGTAFSTIKVAAIALTLTELGRGPINLIDYPLSTQLLVLEAFLASAIFVGLPIAAILATRQKITAELAKRTEELSLLAENVTDAILRFDAEGLCTYASPSTHAVLGRPPEDFIGNRASGKLHPDAREQIEEVERVLLAGEATHHRLTYRRYLDDDKGEAVFIEADCAAVMHPDSREPVGIVVSARDVTQRVALEARLKRAMRHAENAARAKAQFLANMSHEIRTPMNGVLGFAELLRRQDLKGEAAHYAELIERSGRSMMLLLNDILDISKIESGQLAVTQEPVEVARVAEDCVKLHAAQAERAGIALEFTCADAVPDLLLTDQLRLRQILSNLIGNAVKFTERGGVTVTLQCEADAIAFSVVDTGIGIKPSRIERIFDPFIQAEGETTRRYGGTGLGLSISRQLAELLNGTLTVDSMPGIGSRFTLRLPLKLADEATGETDAKKEMAPSLANRPAGRVLLAEDHDVNRMLVSAMLEELGQVVTIARDGAEAIEMVVQAEAGGTPYDLVLMDIQMPGCDGYAATRAIRAERISPRRLPIIALTANAYPEDVAAARDAGMQAHLAKPLVFEDLAAALARWLPLRIVDAQAEHEPLPKPRAKPAGELEDRWQQRRGEAIDAVSHAIRSGSLEGEDIAALARTMHKLAGSAGMFGEEELGSRAAALERALLSGVEDEVRRRLAEELLEAA